MGAISNEFLINLENKLGYKQAKPTNFWVHPDDASVFYIEPHREKANCWDMYVLGVGVGYDDESSHAEIKSRYLKIRFHNKCYAIHTLKALAFHPLGEERLKKLGPNFTYWDLAKNDIIVNHKDGCRYNNRLSNIEWSTQKENVDHAIQTGLRSDVMACVCYDVVNDIEIESSSIQELSRIIDIHAGAISRYIKTGRQALLSNRYMVRTKSEEDYPVKLTKDDIWKKGIDGISPIKIVNDETGEVNYFPLKVYALKFIGNSDKLNQGFKGKNEPIKTNGFTIYPVNDYDKIVELKRELKEKYPSPLRDHRLGSVPWPVMATLEDGTELQFNSTREAAEHFNTNREVIKARLFRHEGHWRGIRFKYVK